MVTILFIFICFVFEKYFFKKNIGFSTIDEDIKEEEPNITTDDYEWYHLNFADSILFGFYAGIIIMCIFIGNSSTDGVVKKQK